MHPEIILHILAPLRSSWPPPSPLMGRWKFVIDGRRHLVGGWRFISFMARLGCKSRKDFPNDGHVDNPSPKIRFISWKYLPYTQREKDAYQEINKCVRKMVDRSRKAEQR